MAYRETAKTRNNRAARQGSILDAALQLTAERGFSGTTVAAIAELAGVAIGSVYRYFPNKAELSSEVFRLASGIELHKVAAALTGNDTPTARLAAAIRIFSWRAFKGRQLAYALIAEPTDPLVEADRLEYRKRYAALFSAVVQEGTASGDFPRQNVQLAASAIVGALAESLIGPLAASIAEGRDRAAQLEWVEELVAFCLRAVGSNPAP